MTKTTPFTYVSLFSGIGGFEQALNKLGGTCVLASEIDKFANQAYEVLYGHKTVGDITKVQAEDVPDHDILVGGFPCQSFSVAGKRGGFDDARGTLFFEMARIADAKNPKVILAENVKGLVGHDKGKTLDTIIKTLNDIGYRVDFIVLNSKYFGVPQNRERIFLIGIREDLIENEPWTDVKGTTVVPKGKRRISGYDDVKTFNFDWPTQTEVTTRLRDVLETEVDEKYYLSEEKTAKLIAQLHVKYPIDRDGEVSGICTDSNISPTVDASYAKGMGPSDIPLNRHRRTHVAEPQMVGHCDIKGHDALLTTMGEGHREPKIAENQSEVDERYYLLEEKTAKLVAQLESKEPSILQLPRGNNKGGVHELSPTVTSNYFQGNNLLSEPQMVGHREPKIAEAKEIRPVLTPDRLNKRQNGRRFKEDGEESFTLTSQDRHGVVEGVPPKSYRIRKLTPLETWRLQGFPDEAHEAVKQAGISDSQRYKMAGNAVTVNVITALGQRLISYLNPN
ncbi:DNA (cytosine-5-)-methyltransferase [Virgibacillus pantothenticus]|uniref:DNA (cytosine-5-)-methyltransferase n=1 Tax=Virgibacillus pantothenticus TaxID=1473 RepID=UPI00098611E2|nr:DNA (cytosine-5-)-methyltransferase [Virgibacillus pantothenticus]